MIFFFLPSLYIIPFILKGRKYSESEGNIQNERVGHAKSCTNWHLNEKKVEFEAAAATLLQNQDGTINANVASNGYPGNKIL